MDDLASGALVSLAVSALKRFTLVYRHPRATAIILSVLSAGVQAVVKGDAGHVLASALTQVAAAIGTFEVVSKPIREIVKGAEDEWEPKQP